VKNSKPASGAKRVPVQDQPVQQLTTAIAQTSLSSSGISSQRVPIERDLSTSTHSSLSRPMSSEGGSARRVKPVAVGTTANQISKKTLPEEDLASILERAKSAQWATRVECFQLLKTFLSSDRHSEVTANQFEKVMKSCQEHLGDPHYKVVLQDLEAMRCLILQFSTPSEAHLEKLLSNLFKKSSDPKEGIRQAVSSVLDSILDCFDIEILLPILFKVQEQSNIIIKTGCLDFILRIVPLSTKYFRNANRILYAHHY
jgi:hypothetical protein